MNKEIINFWVMILLWIVLVQAIITFFMLYRFDFVDKIWKEFAKKYVLNDVYYNNDNFYYYYFTWTSEITKNEFLTDSINYYDKIILWTDSDNINDSLSSKINNHYLDVSWVVNNIDSLKEFYDKTNLKWLYNESLPKN